MSSHSNEPAKPSPSDPRLRRFLKRAVPIIAAERGINERSLIRIRAIADDLRLPNDLYQLGLRKLKKIGVGQKLTRYEREFNRFLRKEFRNLSGGILTVAIENRAIEIATTKYQIPVERAREIILERTVKQNIGRISRTDAEAQVEQMISDRIKGATFIEADTRQRFYSVGKEWGVDRDRVDSIVEQMIANNRDHQKGTSRSIPAYAPFVGAGALALLLIGYFVFYRPGTQEAPDDSKSSHLAVEQIAFPEWWPSSAKRTAASLNEDSAEFSSALQQLVDAQFENRQAGYDRVVQRLLQYPQDDSRFENTWTLFLELANHEPGDDKVIYFANLLCGLIRVDQLPDSREQANDSFTANQLAYRLHQDLTAGPMKDEIASQLEVKTGVTPDSEDYVLRSSRAISVSLWRQLEDAVWNDTPEAISKLSVVAKATEPFDTKAGFHSRLTDSVYGLLEAAPDQWQAPGLKKWLSVVIGESEKSALIRWIDLAQSTPNQRLSKWLIVLISSRLEVASTPQDQQAAIHFLRKTVSGIDLTESRLANRWKQWDESLKRSLPDLSTNSRKNVTPNHLGKASHFATAALILRLKPDDFGLGQFDKLLNAGPIQTEQVFDSGLGQIVFRKPSEGPARTWDTKAKSDLVERISPNPNVTDIARANAFKQLGLLSTRISDLSREEAKTVAEYCLSVTDAKQLEVINQSLPRMSIWLNLGLAFVDALDQASAKRSAILTMLESYTRRPIEIKSEKWKSELKQILLNQIAASLEKTLNANKPRSDESWAVLESAMMEQYRIRCLAAGVEQNEIKQAKTLPELQFLFLFALTNQPVTLQDDKSTRELHALKNLSGSSMEQFMLLEFRVVQEMIQSADTESGEKTKWLERLERETKQSPTLAFRIFAIEAVFCRWIRQHSLSAAGGRP